MLLTVMKDALLTRYHLLPYLYTLFWQAHVFGPPVVRALFYDFPTDVIALNTETQFLWCLFPVRLGPPLVVDHRLHFAVIIAASSACCRPWVYGRTTGSS